MVSLLLETDEETGNRHIFDVYDPSEGSGLCIAMDSQRFPEDLRTGNIRRCPKAYVKTFGPMSYMCVEHDAENTKLRFHEPYTDVRDILFLFYEGSNVLPPCLTEEIMVELPLLWWQIRNLEQVIQFTSNGEHRKVARDTYEAVRITIEQLLYGHVPEKSEKLWTITSDPYKMLHR